MDPTDFSLGYGLDSKRPTILLIDERFGPAYFVAIKLKEKGYQTLWVQDMKGLEDRCGGLQRKTRSGLQFLWGLESFGSVIVHKDLYFPDGAKAGDAIQALRNWGGSKKPVVLTSGEYNYRLDVSRNMLALGAQHGCDLSDLAFWSGYEWYQVEQWLKRSILTIDEISNRNHLMEQYRVDGEYFYSSWGRGGRER